MPDFNDIREAVNKAVKTDNWEQVEKIFKEDPSLAYSVAADIDGLGFVVPLTWGIQQNNAELLKIILDNCNTEKHAKEVNAKCPLHLAIEKGKPDCVRALVQWPHIDMTVRNNDKQGNPPLHLAFLHAGRDENSSQCLAELLKYNTNEKENEKGKKKEKEKKNEKEIEREDDQLDIGLYTEVRNKECDVLLIFAAKNFGLEKFQQVLDLNPNVNAVEKKFLHGMSALQILASKNKPKLMKALLEQKDLNVNLQNYGFGTALHCAAATNSTDCVKVLLAVPGIDVYATNRNGMTALENATNRGNRGKNKAAGGLLENYKETVKTAAIKTLFDENDDDNTELDKNLFIQHLGRAEALIKTDDENNNNELTAYRSTIKYEQGTLHSFFGFKKEGRTTSYQEMIIKIQDQLLKEALKLPSTERLLGQELIRLHTFLSHDPSRIGKIPFTQTAAEKKFNAKQKTLDPNNLMIMYK